MKKITVFLLLIIFISGCNSHTEHQNCLVDDIGFFIWMDGYCAAPEDSHTEIAFSYYYKNNDPTIDQKNISSIAFENISDNVQIKNFELSKLDIKDGTYNGLGITLTIYFLDEGTFESQALVVNLNNNNQYRFPLGNWFFNIGSAQEDRILDTWGSPVATSHSQNFAYDYIIKKDNAIMTSIQYGKDCMIKDINGIQTSGTIDLSNDFEAPIKYIRPKIEILYHGNLKELSSQVGCYCGAIGFEDEAILMSKKYHENNSSP
jgi:hypothetical protein